MWNVTKIEPQNRPRPAVKLLATTVSHEWMERFKKKKEKIPHPHRDILIITILSEDF